MLDWPLTIYRTVRDRAYEATGHVPAPRRQAGNYLNGIQLGLSLRHNGSAAYVVYHGRFFDLATYQGLEDGGVAWLRIDEIGRFNHEVLPRLERPIVVLTPESDWTVPSDFPAECAALVRSGKVRRWFANNYDHSAHREVMVPLPIGLNYEYKYRLEKKTSELRDGYFRVHAPVPARQDARWDDVRQSALPPSRRVPLAFGDFALNNSSRSRRYGESRADIQAVLARTDAVVFPSRRMPREALCRAYGRHAFVISPHGRGLDCYRTWEALACGSIVIVKRSGLDPIYEGLPVVIIDRWEEITRANLERWLQAYGDTFDRARLWQVLSLEYWQREIAAAIG